MKAKLWAFISYCSLNVTTSEIIPGPFLPLDNGSFFRDMKQFGLKRAIWSQGQSWICRTAYAGSSLLPTFCILKGSSEGNFLHVIYFGTWVTACVLSRAANVPSQMTWLHPFRQNTAQVGNRWSICRLTCITPLPWNLLRTAAALCSQHKGLQSPQFTASEQQKYCESTVLPERLKWRYKLRRNTQIKKANGKEKIWKDDWK